MMICSGCSAVVVEGTLVCPSCGASLDDSFAETIIKADAADESEATRIQPPSPGFPANRQSGAKKAAHSSVTLLPSIAAQNETRFVSGAIIADRYRIIGQLGKGGMGEVYRAEDLKLGQGVALKFLPEELANDGSMLARFHREVRIARQVSHPNVCRVFDIGEVNGQHFLSMEYIDGEDLATLMKRIGRLPHDKAVEIARQICAGLAAAHESGVLHRDLKPANIMLDGRGKARITDFGLAGLAGEIRGDDVRSGTPAFMAPEQLAGEEVTVKSDIYSLGLVLYEIFTGKRVFDAPTFADLLIQHEKSTPVTPSSLVKDIDPLVEKVILRCLEKDPKKRPQSALQVAAALPGGDPLAAALAAGETPSPEMLVAAAKEGALKPAIALSLFTAVLALIAGVLFLSSRTMMQNRVPLEKSPEVLADRARTITNQLGYTYRPADTIHGFDKDNELLEYIAQRDNSLDRWNRLSTGQPAALYFWYRQSPRPMMPYNGRVVRPNDPPVNITGMVSLQLDTKGRLLNFIAIPPQYDESSDKGPPPDWAPIFAEAGLDITDFKPVEPRWIPLLYSDSRAAWEGVFPEAPDIPLHIEAASYRSKPVFFSTLSEWDRPSRMEVMQEKVSEKFFSVLIFILVTSILIGGLMMARRNLRLGRGDRKGAFRIGVYVFLVNQFGWALMGQHVYGLDEIDLLLPAMAWSLMFGCFVWVLYIALEPYVRRTNPERIIAWSRLIAGEWRDPLVGRDILIGALIGITLAILSHVNYLAPRWFGIATDPPLMPFLVTLSGSRSMLGMFIQTQEGILLTPMGKLSFFVLLTIVFRRERVAMAILWLFLLALSLSHSNLIKIDLPFIVAGVSLSLLALMRFGLLTAIAAQMFLVLFFYFPLSLDFSAWYAQGGSLAILVAIAIAAYAFYTSLAGQKIFGENFLGD